MQETSGSHTALKMHSADPNGANAFQFFYVSLYFTKKKSFYFLLYTKLHRDILLLPLYLYFLQLLEE